MKKIKLAAGGPPNRRYYQAMAFDDQDQVIALDSNQYNTLDDAIESGNQLMIDGCPECTGGQKVNYYKVVMIESWDVVTINRPEE